MAVSPVKTAALSDLGLLASVVEFKQRFYPRGWARYDLAEPGTLRLVPDGHVLAAVQEDYRSMRNMIYGKYPDIDAVMTRLKTLEDEINGLAQ
jgi:hypothetical protein